MAIVNTARPMMIRANIREAAADGSGLADSATPETMVTTALATTITALPAAVLINAAAEAADFGPDSPPEDSWVTCLAIEAADTATEPATEDEATAVSGAATAAVMEATVDTRPDSAARVRHPRRRRERERRPDSEELEGDNFFYLAQPLSVLIPVLSIN